MKSTQQILWLISFSGCFFSPFVLYSQKDTTLQVSGKTVTLKEVVVRNNLNVSSFIERVQNDTSFYKAFKNLKVLGYTALNDIRMLDKKGKQKAGLQSRTKQVRSNGCRTMQVLEEKPSGDIYDDKKNWNYYTAELYASLFFVKGKVCGEDNLVRDMNFSMRNKSGMAKHKEQLKTLFFNPGAKIPGIPFIGNKIAIFDDDVAKLYDFVIDMEPYQGQNCYVFTITAREDLSSSQKSDIVINKMTTWFDNVSMEIVARTYSLSYNAGVYDFDVDMEVQMTKAGGYLVPKLMRYVGNWYAMLKKREKGVFTATLFDFVQ